MGGGEVDGAAVEPEGEGGPDDPEQPAGGGMSGRRLTGGLDDVAVGVAALDADVVRLVWLLDELDASGD